MILCSPHGKVARCQLFFLPLKYAAAPERRMNRQDNRTTRLIAGGGVLFCLPAKENWAKFRGGVCASGYKTTENARKVKRGINNFD